MWPLWCNPRSLLSKQPLSRRAGLRYSTFAQLERDPQQSVPSTLQPQNLRPADFRSSLPHPFHKFYQKPASHPRELTLGWRHRGSNMAWTSANPPDACRGFLYCHAPRHVSPLAWSVRFRLTPDFGYTSTVSPQTAFAAGSDLQTPGVDGIPWSVPVWWLSKRPNLRWYSELLRADGAQIPHGKWQAAKTLVEEDVILYALGQPLLFEFHMPTIRVHILRHDGSPLVARLEPGYFDWTSKTYGIPYSGMGIMTVERRADGVLVSHLQKIISLTQEYHNPNIELPVEGAMRPLEFGPVLYKEATKRTKRKYIDGYKVVQSVLSALPHVSDIE
ncbi:hypothetical protein C8R47DRAFT_724917 [Mycena vitilis]|nr:hypothetical protein C8R47DRAFT_724917 [Mycena vitilis]